MMNTFFHTLVPALLHTLWIGLVSGSLLFLALSIVPGRKTKLRYALGILALLIVCFGGLVAWEVPNARAPHTPPAAPAQESLSKVSAPSRQPQSANSQPPAPNLKLQTGNTKPPFPKTSPDWRLWIGLAWAGGTLISLLRLVRISFGIQQLMRRSRVVDHPAANRLISELSRVAGRTRRVLLLTGEHIVQPAVVGIFRPAIVLPLSVLTGLPEWQLRAILAHELAHIVRHDFLVNALQLLAETVLFFNPAVWWINRCIREEREACCDALAGQWIDNNRELAEALVEQAALEHSALPAFSDSSPGTLKSRILRLLNPAQQPRLKLPWKSLLLVVLIATAGLFLAKKGTAEAVGYLKRLQKLEEAHAKFETPVQKIIRADVHGFKDCTAEFTIRSEDGSPILLPVYFTYRPRSNHTIGDQIHESEVVAGLGTGELKVRKRISGGRIETIDIRNADFAVFRGAGAAADADRILRIPDIVLVKGFEARLRFVDPEGIPVPEVEITSLTMLGSGKVKKRQAGKNGEFIIPACGSYPVSFSIAPPEGFAPESRSIEFEEGKTVEWILERARRFTGKVVNELGEPVPGALIYLFPDNNNPFSFSTCTNRNVAETRADGGFEFRKMLKNEEYTLGVTAEGYWGQFHVDQTPRNSGQTYTLRKGGEVSVHLRNLKRNTKYLNLGYTFKTGDNGSHGYSFPQEWCSLVSSSETEATYRLHSLWEGEYSLRYERLYHQFKSDEVASSIELDIEELEREQADRKLVKHRIELTLVPPGNEPVPNGTIELNYRHEGWKTCAIPPDGKIMTEVEMRRSRPLEVSVGQMSGYAFDKMLLDSAGTNFTAVCHLKPAGGVALTGLESSGKPVGTYHWIVYEKRPRHIPGIVHKEGNCRNATDGTSMIEPLAFGRKYKIRVSSYRSREEGGTLEYESGWFSVSRSRPVKKLKCVLKPAE